MKIKNKLIIKSIQNIINKHKMYTKRILLNIIAYNTAKEN